MPLNQHLREQWMDRGYCAHAASATVVPPPPAGFKRCYHFTTWEHGLSNIVLRRYKLARFRDVNDPFELNIFYARRAEQKVELEKYIKSVDRKYGFVSLSEDWLDPVMWAHYGKRHTGIVLGLNIKNDLEIKAEYHKKRIPLKADPIKLLSAKFESWRYEREIRMLSPLKKAFREGGMYFESFSDQVRLREVVLGACCTLSLKAVCKVVNTHHNGVVTIQSRLAGKHFSIVPKDRTVPKIAPPKTPFRRWPFKCTCPRCRNLESR